MPTNKEILRHIKNAHPPMLEGSFMTRLSEVGSLDTLHTEMHALESLDHDHNTDGTVVEQTMIVLSNKSITKTENGWAIDLTGIQALQELGSIVASHEVKIEFENTGDLMRGRLETLRFGINVEADTLIDIVRLLLGEAYYKIDQERSEEPEAPIIE